MAVCRLAALLAAAGLAACGVLSPEEQLLTRFFEASRLHDTTAVARLSAGPFNPRISGNAFSSGQNTLSMTISPVTLRMVSDRSEAASTTPRTCQMSIATVSPIRRSRCSSS